MKNILEIGGGRTPYFIRYRTPFNTEDSYTSVDISEKNIEFAKESLEKAKINNEPYPKKVNLILSDATTLDFPENFFDEIVISNTLSAPIHFNWDRDGNILKIETSTGLKQRPILKSSSKDDPFYVERKKMINEAIRVLKNGGVLSIYTDLIIYGTDSYNKILEELKNNPKFVYKKNLKEEERIDSLNLKKLESNEFCCCFRAEVLPKSEVFIFIKT